MDKLQKVVLSLMVVFGVMILTLFILHFFFLEIPFTKPSVGHNSYIRSHLGDAENLTFPQIRQKTVATVGAGAYPDPAVAQVLYQCPAGRNCFLSHVWLYNTVATQTNVVLGMIESGTNTIIALQRFGTVTQNIATASELNDFVLRPGQVLAIWCNDGTDVEVYAYEYDQNTGPQTWYSTDFSSGEVTFTVPSGKSCESAMWTQVSLFGVLVLTHAGTSAPFDGEIYLGDQRLDSGTEAVSAANVPDINTFAVPKILMENQTLKITAQPTSSLTGANISVHFSYILLSQ